MTSWQTTRPIYKRPPRIEMKTRSETTSWGIPKTLKTWFIRSVAVSLAEGSLGKGMNRVALENRSTITRMTELPWDGGRPVMKSRGMCDHGLWGIGKGCRSPKGSWRLDFPWQHTGQASTKLLTSSLMEGHQNRRWRKSRVRAIPGWQVRGESWSHCRTRARTDRGM